MASVAHYQLWLKHASSRLKKLERDVAATKKRISELDKKIKTQKKAPAAPKKAGKKKAAKKAGGMKKAAKKKK